MSSTQDISEAGVNTGNGEVTIDLETPEPSSFVLFALGLLASPAFRRWRNARAK